MAVCGVVEYDVASSFQYEMVHIGSLLLVYRGRNAAVSFRVECKVVYPRLISRQELRADVDSGVFNRASPQRKADVLLNIEGF